jgi:hypothetical protein
MIKKDYYLGIAVVVSFLAILLFITLVLTDTVFGSDDEFTFGVWTNNHDHDSNIVATPEPGYNRHRYPSYIRKGDTIYPTYPSTKLRDYRRPGYKIQGDMPIVIPHSQRPKQHGLNTDYILIPSEQYKP